MMVVPSRRERGIEPLHLLAAASAASVTVISATQPVRDIDVWWHRAIGVEILATGRVSGLGNAWAPFGDQTWITTQWLSEVLLASLVDLAGWPAVTFARMLLAPALAAALAWLLLVHRPARASVPIYVLTLIGLTPFLIQDRPQTLVLLLAVPLAAWLRDGLEGVKPVWWKPALLTVLWANLHGSWLIVPGVFALLLVGAATDPRLRTSVRSWAVIVMVTALAGLATPAGLSGLLALQRFRQRTSHILEWQPTVPATAFALPLIIVLVILIAAWSRSRPILWPELVVVLGLAVFAFIAVRNVSLALILLSSVAVSRLARCAQPLATGATEARMLRNASIMIVIAGIVGGIAVQRGVDPTERVQTREIAAFLASQSGTKRVWNSYNTAGELVEFAGPGIELGIDGRADRYPVEYTTAYLDAERNLIDWERAVGHVDPDFAVLANGTALRTHLESQGWAVLVQEESHTLLGSPDLR